MIAIKYICSFVPSREAGQEDAPLRCRVRWDGSRCIVSLNVGYRVNPGRWDAEEQRCRLGSYHSSRRVPAAVINREIERFRSCVDEVFARFMDQDHFPSTDEVRSALRVAVGIDEAHEVTVLSALEAFRVDGLERLSWTDATITKFKALQSHLTRWHPQLTWDDFGTDSLTDWLVFLREDEGLRNSTIDKQLGFLKWFLKWSAARGYLKCRDYEIFRPKLKNTQRRVIFLTWDELMRVWNFEPSAELAHLVRVRDVFLFCAFTSLRYSDAMNLRWSDVGASSFRVTTLKTADSLEIDLNRWSSEILGRYVDEHYEGGRVFPRVPNQKMNEHLKTIARLCGIDEPVRMTWYHGNDRVDEVHPKWELIGTHCARRTFICNALMMGISPSVIMSWSGHSTYSSMKPYIAIADEARASAMHLFDDKK